MTKILDYLKEVKLSEESPIISDNEIVGWHVVLFDESMNALGGGFDKNKDVARRIAISEVGERKFYRIIKSSIEKNRFMLDSHPSSCGFAAGFQSDKTRYRSISEAIERWAWSKWIDENYLIGSIDLQKINFSESEKFFIKQFDSILFFNHKINTNHIPNFVPSVELSIVLGIKDGGIFPGSRVSQTMDSNWSHALVEAWRHLEIFRKYKGEISIAFPYGRIFYFGKNMNDALRQVAGAYKSNWPGPEILMSEEYLSGIEDFYLWRTLIKDYISWELGDKHRFVY